MNIFKPFNNSTAEANKTNMVRGDVPQSARLCALINAVAGCDTTQFEGKELTTITR